MGSEAGVTFLHNISRGNKLKAYINNSYGKHVLTEPNHKNSNLFYSMYLVHHNSYVTED